ncbi:MAG: NUDIX domain-containing protein [Candidatus Andersenbacteria bacterium]
MSNSSSNEIKVAVGAFIANDKGQVLLGLRKNVAGAGEWQVPGGHLEYGETLIDGARREVKEETGLTVGEMRLVSVIDESPEVMGRTTHYVTVDFSAHYLGGTPVVMEPHKCGGWQWFSLDALPEKLSQGMRMAVENYKNKTVYKARDFTIKTKHHVTKHDYAQSI